MKAGVVIGSLSRNGGGVFDAARHLGRAMHSPPNFDLEVIGLIDEHWSADRTAWGPLNVTALTPAPASGDWGWAPGLRSAIDRAAPDLLHLHGLWMYQSIASLRWARRGGRVLISPHGMLDPWALRQGSLMKRLAALVYEAPNLRRAACLHALCEPEATAMRAYGLDRPICVIPNAVHMPQVAADSARHLDTDHDGLRTLLFLGRLHPKKGLEPLLQAWAQIQRGPEAASWRLAIAGWDEHSYIRHLEDLRTRCDLERVEFLGPRFGDDKAAAFRSASAFILPSFSEGLPVAVLEAWSYGLPVVMTGACNLRDGFAADAAIETSPDAEGIARALHALMSMSDMQRRDMGARGRDLVAQAYSWDVIASQMKAVYAWLVGGGAPPDCVRLH